MKKTKLALAVAAASLVSTSAFATNGTNMVGLGAQSAALGGTGVAAYYGAENVVVNPGLIGKAEGTEFSFGGTLFKPSVKNDASSGGMMSFDSDGDRYVVPSVSLVSRVNDNWTFGIGMYGSSGMGVDYLGEDMMMNAQSNLQIMRFVPTIAFNQDNFGIGFSPILQYGSLDINYDMGGMGGFDNVGSGAADDLGLGFSLGGYFDITENLTVAASYTSKIDMEYKNQLSVASAPFVNPMGDVQAPFSDKLEQPAEMKLGVAYNAGKMTYTAEAKRIKWGDAKGYKDFGWEDQNVFALGVRYDADNFWLGAGFNYGKDPIKDKDTTPTINMFNNMFFPAVTEKHVSIGGGYSLTKNVNIDGAIVRALENTKTVGVMVPDGFGGMAASTNTTKHSQMAYTVTVRYNF